MGLRPSDIFQKIEPSLCPFADTERLRGFFSRASAAGPSPLPLGPWQDRHSLV